MPSMISQQQTTAGNGLGDLNFGIDYAQYQNVYSGGTEDFTVTATGNPSVTAPNTLVCEGYYAESSVK